MSRSRRRKLQRLQAKVGDRARPAIIRTGVPVVSAALFAAVQTAYAGDPAETAATESPLTEVVVTAQKRTENVQDVPISIEVFNTRKLEELHVLNLDDYVKLSPSVSYVRAQGQGGNGEPGSSHVYIRGVVSGGDGNHSGSQPSVGTYLDEEPVTTIDGTVDVHIYDIERIEVLEGPQGTLYGASSESGTIRIITNKPDPSRFAAGYDVDGSHTRHGGFGWEAEGFVNIPLSPAAAIRLVGWDEHDAGFINNVAGTDAAGCIVNGVRTFPTWSGQPGFSCPTPGVVGQGAINNDAYLRDHYNPADTRGGRAALRYNISDDWTVTPTAMAQTVSTEGFFGYDPAVGDLAITHFGPENSHDAWVQTALTVEGKFSDFDLVYAAAFMKRDTHSLADYSDYSEFYDRAYGSGSFWVNNAGQPVMPQELVYTQGHFQKWSHELRLSTPKNLPVRATVGVFIQRQLHNIWEQYTMPGYGFTNPYGGAGNPDGFGSFYSIPGLGNTIWLTDEQRVDRDKAAFLQATWDITSQWSINGGIRDFKYDNSLEGFYGFSANYQGLTSYGSGMASCFGPPSTAYAPCTNLDREVRGSGTVPLGNVTYKVTPDKLVYATFSKGFRPGGVNRTSQPGVGPYLPDFLTNYEIGWKTQWFGHRLRWNGAAFWEDWKNFQFSFLGPNSLTIIENGGNARIKGVENELQWAATSNLMLSTNFTFLDPVLTQNYCGVAGVTSCPDLVTTEPFLPGGQLVGPLAPAGTNLPVVPKFKGNLVARYTLNAIDGWEPFLQASWVYQTQTRPLLRVDESQIIGNQPAYGLVDLAAGVDQRGTMIQLLVTNVADRRAELTRFVQTNPVVDNQPYVVPAQPRTITLKFSQRF
jgi:outer membrane receptor protein involved in Fe transport